jgi:hypothetical protein
MVTIVKIGRNGDSFIDFIVFSRLDNSKASLSFFSMGTLFIKSIPYLSLKVVSVLPSIYLNWKKPN